MFSYLHVSYVQKAYYGRLLYAWHHEPVSSPRVLINMLRIKFFPLATKSITCLYQNTFHWCSSIYHYSSWLIPNNPFCLIIRIKSISFYFNLRLWNSYNVYENTSKKFVYLSDLFFVGKIRNTLLLLKVKVKSFIKYANDLSCTLYLGKAVLKFQLKAAYLLNKLNK